ncbi:MAG: DUF503 family protein [Polyangiaceae bacterium]|jgi:uncharacterized protein YlxP (DUF503 family)
MVVGVLRLTFHVPGARSLKDKRRVIRRFRDRIRARFDVSIAEVGGQDKMQRAVFGVSVISSRRDICEGVLEDVARAAQLDTEAVLTSRETEFVTFGQEMFGDDDGS